MSEEEQKLKASEEAALRMLNQTETWWERHARWIVLGAIVVLVIIGSWLSLRK